MKNEIVASNSNSVQVMGDYGLAVNDFNVRSLLTTDVDYVKIFAPGYEMDDVDAYNALQSPMHTVNESIGQEINLCGLIVHSVEVVNENTGELVNAPRIILIDDNGDSYVSVSKTLFSSLKNLFAMYKRPEDWSERGIPIKFKQTSKGNKRYFGIEIVKKNRK